MKNYRLPIATIFLFFFITNLFANKLEDLIKQKKYNQALIILKKDILPNDVDSRLKIAYIYSWTKKYSEAETNFLIVLKLAPNYYDALFGLANVYYWQGKYDEAIRLLEKYKNSEVAEKVYEEIYKNQIAAHKYIDANKTYKIGRSKNYSYFQKLKKVNTFQTSAFYSEANNAKKIGESTKYTYWRYFNFNIKYLANKTSVNLGYSNFYRYKSEDNLFSIGFSKDLTGNLSTVWQYNICNKPHFLEKYSIINDNFFKLRKYNSFLQFSEFYKLYPNKSQTTLIPGVNYTILKYYTSTFKYFYAIDSDNKKSSSFQVMETYDNSKLRLSVSYSKGNEIVDSNYNPLLDSETYLGKFKYKFYKEWVFLMSYSYYKNENNLERNEFGCGIEVRF